MAIPTHDEGQSLDRGFLDNSYLTYLVPFATDFQAEQAFAQHEGASKDFFSTVERRDWLFFDETADIYMVLRTPFAAREQLQSSLGKVSIAVEARIVNGQVSDRDAPSASEVIYSGIIEEDQTPIIVSDGEAEEDEEEEGEEEGEGQERYSYAIWKLSVFLARPRMRLQAPSIVFQAAASVRVSGLDVAGGSKKGYLQSGVPSGLNLLESFGGDPGLGGIKPRLSALRVSRVAPATQSADQLRPVKGLASLAFKIYPAVHTRVRFARPNTTPPSPALVALLEVDFTPFFDCEVLLDRITLSITEGVIEDLNPPSLSLPLRCVAHDHITFMYRLAPQQLDTVSKNPTRELDITLSVTALVSDDDGGCAPRLTLSWATAIDFTLPVNPGFGQPLTRPIQRSHRPSQLSIGGQTETLSLISPRISRPDALPSLEAAAARSTEVPIPDFGITMTFSGPQGPVRAGEEFVWSIFVVNRTRPEPVVVSRPTSVASQHHGQQQPPQLQLQPPPATPVPSRKLALLPIPRRRRADSISRPLQQQQQQRGKHGAAAEQVAEAVLDDSLVHAAVQQRGDGDGDGGGADVVCLSADVRVGPLAPGACAVVELRFLALRRGVVGVEAVRVVDLGSQEHVDVRELPVVVVE